MRSGFDRAMQQEKGVDSDKILFPLVVDAGCGTGLAGEVVRRCIDVASNLLIKFILSAISIHSSLIDKVSQH
jgi:predicted TPR repeat methyltransferase